MARIEIYTSWSCPYSLKAKNLLETKHLPYREIDITKGEDRCAEMTQRSGRSTTPQIFIDGKAIGGYDDLVQLNVRGELDRLAHR